MKQRTLVTRNAAVLLLWLNGCPLEDIGDLFDLGRDRLLLILLTLTAAQGRPSHMPLEKWRDATGASAPAKATSIYVNPQGLRTQ
jgi:hypothetical protein